MLTHANTQAKFKLLVFCTLVISGNTFGNDIYRWTDAKGVVHFSDHATENAEKITVRPTQTIDMRTPAAETSKESSPEKTNKGDGAIYTQLEITSPANGSAFHAPDGSVDVTFSAQPEIASGHLFRLTIDGKVAYTGASTSTTLQNVDRGTHNLQVSIIDNMGMKLISSTSLSITIHRPIANRSQTTPSK
ncbi:MAG: DUF4124 domain-containing protein [Hahellaceae bacterium]|nr:DUF4124 domain-containing protein [Hahellaceae bacterium]MCP5168594.1 DUF4124 domain-containing protein [Hahellaceae bacterium]